MVPGCRLIDAARTVAHADTNQVLASCASAHGRPSERCHHRGRGSAVIDTPDVTYTGMDGKPNVLGEVNGKRIRVCFVEDNTGVFIITVVNRGPAT